jgi:PqqD family protein of HPr-rel-A system
VRLTAVDGLLIRHFDDEAVVFDPLSWDAHLLNPAAIAVLELLIDAPCSETEIAELLRNALLDEERPHAVAHAHRLIGELRSLGLIRGIETPPIAYR